jgi:hypothetical protein
MMTFTCWRLTTPLQILSRLVRQAVKPGRKGCCRCGLQCFSLPMQIQLAHSVIIGDVFSTMKLSPGFLQSTPSTPQRKCLALSYFCLSCFMILSLSFPFAVPLLGPRCGPWSRKPPSPRIEISFFVSYINNCCCPIWSTRWTHSRNCMANLRKLVLYISGSSEVPTLPTDVFVYRWMWRLE